MKKAGDWLRRVPLDWWIALGIFVLAAVLRVWGVGSSLPYVDNPDEPNVVSPAVHIARTGDLNPHFFQYPALLMYVEALLFKLNLVWGTWRGYYAGPQSLPDSNYGLALAPAIYSWGRTLVALVGAATVAGTYGVGRAMFGRWGRAAGLLAAVLLLTSPLQILNSHSITADVPMAAMGVAVLAASWRLATRPSRRIALLTGLLVGLCAATKYNGATAGLVASMAWLVAWLNWPTEGDTDKAGKRPSFPAWSAVAVGMLATALIAFLLINIFILLDWQSWRASFLTQYNGYVPAGSASDTWKSFTDQTSSLFDSDPAILISGIAGAIALTVHASRHTKWWQALVPLLLLVPFPLVHLLAMSRFQITYERNLVILLPFLCMLAGGGLSWLLSLLVENVEARWHRAPVLLRTATFPALLLGVLLTLGPIRDMLNLAAYLGLPDSRNLAYNWVRQELQAGRRVAVELTPWQFCPPDPFTCALPDVYAPGSNLTDQAPSWYASHGYDYVVLLGRDTNLLAERAQSDEKHSAKIAQFTGLDVVQHFNGDKDGGKGPYIEVLRAGDGMQSAAGITKSGAIFGDLAQLSAYAYAPISSITGHYDPADGSGVAKDKAYHPGTAVGLSLYWHALKGGTSIAGDYSVGVRLIAPTGDTVQKLDIGPVSSWHVWPTWQWYPNAYLAGVYNVPLPATLAPGTYHLRVTLYNTATSQPLPITLASSTPTQDYLDIGTIEVK